jgi:hypothetical protein
MADLEADRREWVASTQRASTAAHASRAATGSPHRAATSVWVSWRTSSPTAASVPASEVGPTHQSPGMVKPPREKARPAAVGCTACSQASPAGILACSGLRCYTTPYSKPCLHVLSTLVSSFCARKTPGNDTTFELAGNDVNGWEDFKTSWSTSLPSSRHSPCPAKAAP